MEKREIHERALKNGIKLMKQRLVESNDRLYQLTGEVQRERAYRAHLRRQIGLFEEKLWQLWKGKKSNGQ